MKPMFRLIDRSLDPSESLLEILFGLIMALTMTAGARLLADPATVVPFELMVALVGCNVAWGIIDGILYLMGCLADKGRNLLTLRAVRKASDPQKAQSLIAGALPPLIASILQPAELEAMRQRLVNLPEPPAKARVGKTDLIGAFGVFLLVFITTFPVAIPFIFMHNAMLAMRVSNGVAVAMLFLAGFLYGRNVGRSPWAFGVAMVILGAVLVALTMALGG